jgi:hypothetical protein
MKDHVVSKKLLSIVMAGMLGLGISYTALPMPEAHADIWGAILSGVKGAQDYAATDKAMNYYNNTEQGRQELLAGYKEKYGVCEDEAQNNQLASMMNNLVDAVGAVDNTIYKKPYLYFVNKETSFNAFCSMGHVMSVNTGLYSVISNPDEIAVVLLHEMGHGQKDHVVNATRKKMRVAIASGVLGSAVGNGTGGYILDMLVNHIDKVQITKKDEWEADNLALTYLLHSNYNPGASAAIWQRMMDSPHGGNNDMIREIFSPSDHPSNMQRRDNYSKRMTDLTGGDVTVDKGVVKIGGKEFVKPNGNLQISGKERAYFVLGNLVRAYQNQLNAEEATSDGSTVYLGSQAIMTSMEGDPDAATLAQRLNALKSSKPVKIPAREQKLQDSAKPEPAK